jgi:hypothetical protein
MEINKSKNKELKVNGAGDERERVGVRLRPQLKGPV